MTKKSADYFDSIINYMFQAIMVVAILVIMIPRLPVTQAAQRYFASQRYSGQIDPRTLDATEELRWINLVDYPPYTPWISATFYNEGPDKVYIAVNRPDNWLGLDKRRSFIPNLAGGDTRIEIVYYKCEPGKTAEVTVEGKY